MPRYRQHPKDTKSSNIRLLRIEYSSADQPITLSTRRTSLDHEESFNALSYAWGEDDVLHDTGIHDGEDCGLFGVRLNPHDCLFTARISQDGWATRWIWIDQICIDQSHLNERYHQVAQMASLCSTALATIAWPFSTRTCVYQSTAQSDNRLAEIYSREAAALSSTSQEKCLESSVAYHPLMDFSRPCINRTDSHYR
ncbi:heterokaryon incompatibility protein [Stagonosporopsis vannaccii]|nr:heterokaryon incompatibility protein [Stagonosporopsis vannaccii]